MHVNVRKGSIVCIFFFFTQNICDTHPCLNNGKCYFKYTDKRYGCVCASGYTGENCEKGKFEPTFKNSIVLLTAAAEER